MDKRKLSNMLLILTALIWGSAFVAQSIGMEYIGPFTFGAVREHFRGIDFAPGHHFSERKSHRQIKRKQNRMKRKKK